MFEYYTALTIVTSSIIISAYLVTQSDDVIDRFSRNTFLIAYIMLLLMGGFDWLAIYLEKNNPNLQMLSTFLLGVVIFLAPSINAILTLGINDKKSKPLTYFVVIIILLSFCVGFSGLFSDSIFYYDEQNVFHRGNYFFIHIILIVLSSLMLFINTFRLGIKYQNRNNFILVLDLVLFIGALLVQYFSRETPILWISYLIGIGFGYIYYATTVSQIDVLTSILNRKCYDSQLYSIHTDVIILFFDVNKFKEINDTVGHGIGDYCLVEIAKAIKTVYGKSGYCYRIGGDEFSVILHKNLESIDELNSRFSKLLFEGTYEYELPTVSIGYSYYYPNKSSIQKVIDEADAMMYSIKQQRNLSDGNNE